MNNDDRTLPVDADVLDELRRLADQIPPGRPGERSVGVGGSSEPEAPMEPVLDLRRSAPDSNPRADHTVIVDDDTTDALRALAEHSPLIRRRPEPSPAAPPPPDVPPPADLPPPLPVDLPAPELLPRPAPTRPPTTTPHPGRWMPPERIAVPVVRRARRQGFTGRRRLLAVVTGLALALVVILLIVAAWLLVVRGDDAGDSGTEVPEEIDGDGDG